MNFKIRPYKLQDKAELVRLIQLNIPKYFHPSEEADFVEYLDNQIEDYFVIGNIQNEILGCGGINYLPESKEARISWDLLHPAWQGKGLGKNLLQHRINHINGLSKIDSITVRTSQLAFKFYEKSGFKLKYTEENYWSPGFDLYFMEYVGQID